MKTNVIIVGKGIAGLICAYLLQQKGIDFLLLDRVTKPKSFALAETLPPSAMPLLHALQLKELFESCAIRKTNGYHSLWGNKQVSDYNFFFNRPFNYGLKLNKQALLAQLEKKIAHRIVEFNQIHKIIEEEKGIHLKIDSQSNTISGKVMIEATGRKRAILHQLGIHQTNFDGLVSFSCHVPKIRHPKVKHDVFVEAFEEGWGIVSGLNEHQHVMSLFTLRTSPALADWKYYENWKDILKNTELFHHFLSESAATKVVGGDANSSKANQVAGKNWLAVGDAAMAFDPLSSHGITTVLYTAKKAIEAIEKRLTRNPEFEFSTYSTQLNLIFSEYLKNRAALYKSEKRWKNSPFWSDVC